MRLGSQRSVVGSMFGSVWHVIDDNVLQAVATLAKSKPTYVAIGDLQTLPYPDELGL